MLPAQNIVLNSNPQGIPKKGLVAAYKPYKQKNLLKYSEDFSNAAWTKSLCAIIGGNKLISDNTANNTHYIIQQITTVIGKVYTAYIDVKAAELSWIRFVILGTSLGSKLAYVNLSTGVLGTTTISTNLTNLGDNVYRCSITFVAADTATSFLVYLAEGNNDVTFDGDGTSGIYIYRAQLELGSVATPYQKTLGNQSLFNQVTTPMYVPNIVINGDFRNGATGWGTYQSTVSAANNILSITGTGSAAACGTAKTLTPYANGKRVYTRVKARVTNAVAASIFAQNWASGMTSAVIASQSNPAQNIWYHLSNIVTLGAGGSGSFVIEIRHTYADAATANGKVMEVQEVFSVDLGDSTSILYNLTTEQCDFIWDVYHEGTRYMDVPLYNGTLGSTTGADTNDPTFMGQGLSFGGDDYGYSNTPSLGYNWTVLVVAKRNSGITAEGDICSFNNGAGATGMQFFQNNSTVTLKSGADNVSLLDIPPNDRVLFFAGQSKQGFLKLQVGDINTGWMNKNCIDTLGGFNIGRIGPAGYYWNGDIYSILLYNCALSDIEIKQAYRAIKKELAEVGVIAA